ncbi:MAG: glycosyl hydrolase family 18 protein [Calothrix sp. MO_167.B42]|nr:glycosyl hydrolase family 18 protein [Calothrix sp. MO_167.B42]
MTSARVLKPVFNKYQQDTHKPKVFGYYTDWSQYDGRYENCVIWDTPGNEGWPGETADAPPQDGDVDYDDRKACAGRGYDLAELDPLAYDEIILGFLGICGDSAGNDLLGGSLASACAEMGKDDYAATFVDLWADISAEINNNIGDNNTGSNYNETDSDESRMYQTQIEAGYSRGVLTGLYNLQKKAKDDFNHNLELAFSIGGWSLSDKFSELVANPSYRRTFIESVGDVFNRFPMFSTVDIDWEYPGGGGQNPSAGNPANDGPNYALLIGELRQYLDDTYGVGVKKINIAASAKPESLALSNIAGLFRAGLDGINVMTYDFFGGNWANVLAHHTNLGEYDSGEPEEKDINSVEEVINYLRGEGIDMSKVYIGYAGYSRNALGANITSYSPLAGNFTQIPEGQDGIGTFDPLASEYNDVLYNYFDPENKSGKNGYELYTDAEANADYLYSDSTDVFMSIDTPRSVYAKGKYAADQGLGGIFTWTIDQDKGLLANAAREGAGYGDPIESAIDMSEFYFCGKINSNDTMDEATCQQITGNGSEPSEPKPNAQAGPDQTVTVPVTVHLDGTASSDPGDNPITYSWEQSSGPQEVTLVNRTTATPYFEAPEPAGLSETYVFTLTVDNGDKTDTDSVTIVVETEEVGGCSYDYVYPDGIGSYVDGMDGIGTIVMGTDGNLYECGSDVQSVPVDGWCNNEEDPTIYGPVEGWDWSEAWKPYNCAASTSNRSKTRSRTKRSRKKAYTSNMNMAPTTITIEVKGPLNVTIK